MLVAEDDRKQAELLRAYLAKDGHAVSVVHDGRAALDALRTSDPDLLVLDVMMPLLDGRDVLRVTRGERRAAVIMVTAMAAEADQLLGFDLGADDYVTKPYSPRQLVARVNAVLRRTAAAQPSSPVVVIGSLSVDSERFEARRDGQVLPLTPREFRLLETLASQPGRAFSRGELLEAIAGFDSFALERTVDMHIMNIRRKVEADPAHPTCVVTVKGRGYKLDDTADGAPGAVPGRPR
ncbi:response regulator transcription factor [Quadrisphaera setariae]|uniref:Response regulator transcription factor n=1 Tax=Quadrisphaera setariae TaxID=2593304 RepID=A0A5C8ZEJ1_9ACTN|nr:response regulator transcription factor [Quadrisphaera setariae]